MGRGNICVRGRYEHLLYIDNEDYTVYYREGADGECETANLRDLAYADLQEWTLDEEGTNLEWEYVEESFVESFATLFPSFTVPAKMSWLDRDRRILAENKLYWLVVEDNEWSMAVEIIQKENPYDDSLLGLQARHHEHYFDGMKKCLLELLPSVGVYKGAWTSGTLTAEEFFATERKGA